MTDVDALVVPVLSRAKSHGSLTISCGIFGLGLGATMVTGNTVMRNALGTWNIDKVDVILDLMSGVLILVTGSVMGKFNCTQVINRTQIIRNWIYETKINVNVNVNVNEYILANVISKHHLQ
jgi:hypothetical protein